MVDMGLRRLVVELNDFWMRGENTLYSKLAEGVGKSWVWSEFKSKANGKNQKSEIKTQTSNVKLQTSKSPPSRKRSGKGGAPLLRIKSHRADWEDIGWAGIHRFPRPWSFFA